MTRTCYPDDELSHKTREQIIVVCAPSIHSDLPGHIFGLIGVIAARIEKNIDTAKTGQSAQMPINGRVCSIVGYTTMRLFQRRISSI